LRDRPELEQDVILQAMGRLIHAMHDVILLHLRPCRTAVQCRRADGHSAA
jgi:hypothetical protein